MIIGRKSSSVDEVKCNRKRSALERDRGEDETDLMSECSANEGMGTCDNIKDHRETLRAKRT